MAASESPWSVSASTRSRRFSKVSKPLGRIKYFEFAEVQAVLKAVDIHENNGRRDLALLSLMFNTGARVSEVIVSVNTTNKYLSIDLAAKRDALAKAKPCIKEGRSSGKWRKNGNLIAWLTAL